MTVTEKHAVIADFRQTETQRDEIEQDAAIGIGILVRGAEVALAVFAALIVVPPLAILVVVVAVPLLATAIVVGGVAGIVAAPFVLARHVRGHHRTHRTSVAIHQLRRLRARVA